MSALPVHKTSPRRGAATATALLAVFIALGGCKSTGDVTGSIAYSEAPLPASQGELRAFAEGWGKRFDADPNDKSAAINYARALRALTRYPEAAAVMRQIAITNPNDLEVLGNYGKALADAGRFAEAAQVLENAHTQERPNWSILSAQGSVADQIGDHERAQSYYHAALKIVPGEPSVLSNLGLSYALAKQLPLAERTLRQAASHPAADGRVRQNLALVLSLQGKFAEAEQIASRDLPPAEAAQNVATIRRMTAQSNTWRELQALEARKAKPKAQQGTAPAKPATGQLADAADAETADN